MGLGPLWHPEAMSFTAFLSKWAPNFSRLRIDPVSIGPIIERYDTDAYVLLTLGRADRIVHLCCEADTDSWGGVVSLPGLHSRKRAETSQWLLDRVTKQIDMPSPEGSFFSPALFDYLANLLRLLDGIAAGANLRELATVLIDPELATHKAAFAGSGAAKKIERWRADALWLVHGGYRRLLRGEWPSQPRR